MADKTNHTSFVFGVRMLCVFALLLPQAATAMDPATEPAYASPEVKERVEQLMADGWMVQMGAHGVPKAIFGGRMKPPAEPIRLPEVRNEPPWAAASGKRGVNAKTSGANGLSKQSTAGTAPVVDNQPGSPLQIVAAAWSEPALSPNGDGLFDASTLTVDLTIELGPAVAGTVEGLRIEAKRGDDCLDAMEFAAATVPLPVGAGETVTLTGVELGAYMPQGVSEGVHELEVTVELFRIDAACATLADSVR